MHRADGGRRSTTRPLSRLALSAGSQAGRSTRGASTGGTGSSSTGHSASALTGSRGTPPPIRVSDGGSRSAGAGSQHSIHAADLTPWSRRGDAASPLGGRPTAGSINSTGTGTTEGGGRTGTEADLGWMDGYLDGVVDGRHPQDSEHSQSSDYRRDSASRRDSRRSLYSAAGADTGEVNVGMYRKPLLEDYDGGMGVGGGAEGGSVSSGGAGRERTGSDASSVWRCGGKFVEWYDGDLFEGGPEMSENGSAAGEAGGAMYRPPSRLLVLPSSGAQHHSVDISTPPR